MNFPKHIINHTEKVFSTKNPSLFRKGPQEAGERREKWKRPGDDGKEEREEAPAFSLFPSSTARLQFFYYYYLARVPAEEKGGIH